MFWFNTQYTHMVQSKSFLDEQDLSMLEERLESISWEDGEAENMEIRSSQIKWIHAGDPIFQKVGQFILEQNVKFQKTIYGIEPLQFTTYHAEENGRYGAHYDNKSFMGGYERKLSFSIQLSDDSEYDGGDMVIYNPDPIPMSRNKGSMMVFDSGLLHEVKPVTKGIRKSLVGWVFGPRT